MSETIDLTRDDNSDDGGRKTDQTNHQEGQRKRKKTSSRPKSVYVIIHDKEPQDSGSDHHRSSFLPARQDTEIVGIYYDYTEAVSAAEEYVMEEFDVDEDSDDDGSDGEGPLSHIDWEEEGWLREEELDANECNDRVHIQKHDVY